MLKLSLRPANLLRNFASQATACPHAANSADIEWKNAKPYSEIPSPGLGMLFKFMPGGELYNTSILHMNQYFHKNFGNIARMRGMFGAQDVVMIYDPQDFATVFRKEGQWPQRKALEGMDYYREKLRRDVYKKNGLLGNDGPQWQEFRSVVNPVLMQPKTVELYVNRIDEVTRELVEIIREARDEKDETPADFGHYMERWSLESMGTIALDTRLGVLEKSKNNKGDRLAYLMESMFELSFELEAKPSLWRIIKTPKFAKLMRMFDEVTNITLSYVQEAIKRIENEKEPKPVEQQGVLEKLLRIDRDIATVMSMDMLAVGVDTTSSTAKSLLYLLATNPVRQEKLRKEILSILPTKDTLLTPEKMRSLPYLRACMKEAHRILPVIAGTVRGTQQDLVLQGYQIPKGTWIVMAGGILTDNEENFSKPREFIPERWLKDDSHKAEGVKHAKEAHPFIYLPFGFGPRMCVGRRFAELEIETFIIRFLREFEVSWKYPEPKMRSTFINSLTGDLKFTMKELDY
ncbi:probable cytochrome P450 12a5, mitochondrial [Culicoides brevitarsis]|uniref:probable cytochrome P450 12a5, mitochondrial n=1 Tax=Culicoides brevitarsis TaxID=469753 RepID=UPI00307CA205